MIKLVKDYVVRVDCTGYTLMIDVHKTDKEHRKLYKTLGYYSSLESAIKGCIKDINCKQFSVGTYSLEEAVKVICENNKLLSDLLNKCLGGN